MTFLLSHEWVGWVALFLIVTMATINLKEWRKSKRNERKITEAKELRAERLERDYIEN